MKNITALEVSFHQTPVGSLTLDVTGKLCLFRYSAEWLSSGFSISPFELPLKPEVFIANPEPFAGDFGIFEDSLPDGYGRYLLHRELKRHGLDSTRLSSLERLSLVGDSGMGALCYAPASDLKVNGGAACDDFDSLQRIALKVLSERSDSEAGLLLYNSGNSGGARPKAVFYDNSGHWLVKFRHIFDPQDIGIKEFECNQLARKCGINIPDFKLTNGRYFTTRRFDITDSGERLHVATAGGLMGLSLSTPTLDYSNLLALTGFLTQKVDDVEEMFRRMVFNYLIGNKDDHCKNFSFYVVRDSSGQWGWRLAPAYDLTVNSEGYNGQHATSVNGTAFPKIDDFIAVGTRIQIPESRSRELYESIADHVN
ncbi:MAG: type II toxin-antitoxin system HipA family toxin [Bacteroides sp.]|nr:type II toxin-antitoxin system HipA family toxin [Bacteroides sp.]